MKTPNENVTRLVIWSVTSSVIASSCSDGSLINSDLQVPFTQENESQSNVISIKIAEENVKSVQDLTTLVDKIISDSSFAKEFKSCPQKYLLPKSSMTRSGNMDDGFAIDEELNRFVSALADDDVLAAIEKKDIKTSLILMYERGYIDVSQSEKYAELLTPEQRQTIMESLSLNEDDALLVVPVAFVSVFWAVVAVQSAIIGASAVIFEVQAAVQVAYLYHLAVHTSVKVSGVSVYEPGLDIILLRENESIAVVDELRESMNEVFEAYDVIQRDIINNSSVSKSTLSAKSKEKIIQTAELNLKFENITLEAAINDLQNNERE